MLAARQTGSTLLSKTRKTIYRGHRRASSYCSWPLLLLGSAAAASEFSEVVIDAGFQLSHPAQFARLGDVGSHQIVLAGRDADLKHHIAVFQVDDVSTGNVSRLAKIAPDSKKIAYDIARFEQQDALVFIEPGRIVAYDLATGNYRPIANINSLYGQDRSGELVSVDFFRDLNSDELDDLIVTDVAGYRVRLQNPDGSLGPESLLKESVTMNISDGSVNFQNRTLVTGDMNFDGLDDLSVWSGRSLQIYLQLEGGLFAQDAIQRDTGIDVLTELELRALENDRGAVDQEGLTESRIYSIEDLNGDKLPDILTESTFSEGMFDRRNEFRLHLGRAGSDLVAYEEAPNALLASEGLLFDPISTDIDGDGRQDLLTRKAKLSFGRIIRALISGGIPLEIQFFRMTEDETYPAEANHATKTKVKFSRSSGQVDIPTFQVADFDGDGLQDLLLQSDVDELGYYRGIADDRLFDKLTAKVSVKLPRNGELVRAEDINGDDRVDLVMRYSVADSDELAKSLRLLIYTGN